MITIIKWIYIVSTNVALLGILLSICSACHYIKENYPDLCEWNKEYKKTHSTDLADVFARILPVGFICFCPFIHFAMIKLTLIEFESFRDGIIDKTVSDIKAKKKKELHLNT